MNKMQMIHAIFFNHGANRFGMASGIDKRRHNVERRHAVTARDILSFHFFRWTRRSSVARHPPRCNAEITRSLLAV